jgi:hypothetical protein
VWWPPHLPVKARSRSRGRPLHNRCSRWLFPIRRGPTSATCRVPRRPRRDGRSYRARLYGSQRPSVRRHHTSCTEPCPVGVSQPGVRRAPPRGSAGSPPADCNSSIFSELKIQICKTQWPESGRRSPLTGHRTEGFGAASLTSSAGRRPRGSTGGIARAACGEIRFRAARHFFCRAGVRMYRIGQWIADSRYRRPVSLRRGAFSVPPRNHDAPRCGL